MPCFLNSRRLVIKVGSSLLVEAQSGLIRSNWLQSLVEDVLVLKDQGIEVIIVTSGSVAIGQHQLGQSGRSTTLNVKQAAAAVGQIQLMRVYQDLFEQHHLIPAQVLLTLEDTESRRRYLHLSNTIETLLKLGCIPILNENDSVATAEIVYGDNDRLAARVAQMCNADTLILLSDIDGFYSDDPHLNPNAEFIDVVEHLNDDIYRVAKDSHSNVGSGGMITKIAAAKIATANGCQMLITSGHHYRPLSAYLQSERGTWFLAELTPRKAKKRWLTQHLNHAGVIVVDDGAVKALKTGASLLPVGVCAIEGDFEKGDVVVIKTQGGASLTCGLSNYASYELAKIKGLQTLQIEAKLGYAGCHEVIHRDNLGYIDLLEGSVSE